MKVKADQLNRKKNANLKNKMLSKSGKMELKNPFDFQKNASKLKHTVLGQRVKGKDRNVAHARAMAHEKRNKSLLVEYKNRKKSSNFHDKRIGEMDGNVSMEEKMLRRFQEEQRKKYRSSSSNMFTLGDAEDTEDNFLTHKGTAIDESFNFDKDAGPEEQDTDALHSRVVDELHFGGGEEAPVVKKSHQEIMKEVIAKSKFFKAERQKNKFDQEETTDQLDSNFSDFQSLLSFRPTRKDTKAFDRVPLAELDEYDKMTRALTFEAKVKASEKKLTATQIAEQERKKLHILEKERLDRIQSLVQDANDAQQCNDFVGENTGIEADFSMSESDVEGELSDSDNVVEQQKVRDQSFNIETDVSTVERIPFILACPESAQAIDALFAKYSASLKEKQTIISRIRRYYSPRLGVENAALSEKFLSALMHRFHGLSSNFAKNRLELEVLFEEICEMSYDSNENSGEIFRSFVINLRTKLLENTHSKWPTFEDLLTCQLPTLIYSISDLRHNIVTPLENYLCDCLANIPIDDVVACRQSLLACTVLVQINLSRNRFAPEVILYFEKLLSAVAKHAPSCAPNCKPRQLHSKLRLDDNASDSTPEFWDAMVGSAIALVSLVSEKYHAISSFPELINPLLQILSSLSTRWDFTSCLASISALVQKNLSQRRPLRLQAVAPKMIASLEPNFNVNYTVRKDKNEDKEKAKTKQLQRQVKRERKAAARELRLDAAFIANEQMKEQTNARVEKQRKQQEIQSWVMQQSANFNQQVRKGGELIKGGGSGLAKKRRLNKK